VTGPSPYAAEPHFWIGRLSRGITLALDDLSDDRSSYSAQGTRSASRTGRLESHYAERPSFDSELRHDVGEAR
jgi:hypothetical protein